MDPNELDRLAAVARLTELLNDIGIDGAPALSMLGDPFAAVPILEGARRKRGIRNPAAFATRAWQRLLEQRARPVRAPEPRIEVVDEPPTLSHLEHHWSLGMDARVEEWALRAYFVPAIERAGGLRAMLERDFDTRLRFEGDGFEEVAGEPA